MLVARDFKWLDDGRYIGVHPKNYDNENAKINQPKIKVPRTLNFTYKYFAFDKGKY